MTTGVIRPLPLVDHSAPQLSGMTTEVVTVSVLLSMPAVWTTVVDRALPVDVLLERFMIVLLSCALLAWLVRRLGEGGVLSRSTSDNAPADTPATTAGAIPATAAPTPALDPLAADLGDLGDLGGFDLAPLDLDADPFADPA